MASIPRRLLVIVFWLGAGALLAGVLGFVLGRETAVWPFVVGIAAIAGVGPLVVILGVRGARGPGLRLRPDPAPPSALPRQIARVESLRELGVTVRNFDHLYEFTVTLFPASGPARRETFSQFITMGQLPNFFTGRYVVVAVLDETPPRLLLDAEPDARWTDRLRTAPERFDDISAQVRPRADDTAPESRTSAPRRALNLALVVLLVAAGFVVSTTFVLGGTERALAMAAEVPDRIAGDIDGPWDSAVLDLDLADLRDAFGGRDIEYLVLLPDSYSIGTVSETDPAGQDVFSYHGGGTPSLAWNRERITEGTFAIDDVDADVIRAVAAYVSDADPHGRIDSLQVRASRGPLTIEVSIDGVYSRTSATFDGTTGAPLEAD